MALTFAAYAAPDAQKPVAVAAVVVLTAVNTQGIHRTAALTRVIVVLVLAGSRCPSSPRSPAATRRPTG